MQRADSLKHLFLLALFLAPFATANAADPIIESWFTTNSAGYARVYKTTTAQNNGNSSTTWTNQNLPVYSDIQAVMYSTSWTYVQYSGLASYVMGPWLNPQGGVFQFWPTNQHGIRRFPRTPVVQSGNKDSTSGGYSGLFVNGVAIFNSLDGQAWNGSSISGMAPHTQLTYYWHRNAPVAEAFNFDPAFGHQPPSAVYHTHQNPIALRYQLADHVTYNSSTKEYSESTGTISMHSPIVGWAHDGYPIYGPYGYSSPMNASSGLRRMVSGYVKRDGNNGTDSVASNLSIIPAWYARFRQKLGAAYSTTAATSRAPVNGTYPLGTFAQDWDYLGDLGKTQGTDFDLDVYNGRFCVTPEYPGGTYAYFVTIDAAGDSTYPYVLAFEFYGDATGGSVASISETVTTHYVGGPFTNLELYSPIPNNTTRSVTLVWNSVEGGTYQVESSTNQINWITNISGMAAFEGIVTQTNYTGSNGIGYARVTRTALAGYDSATTGSFTSTQTDTGSYTINSLSITTHPQSQSVSLGASTSFSVVAGGVSPFSYQWRLNGSDIPSATSSTYSIPSVGISHVGNYSVVVTNSTGSITSSNASLSITGDPTISTHPQTQTANPGATVTFTVVATGTAPITYQWLRNGTNISGANGSSFTINNVQASDATIYAVVVTSAGGSLTSNTATLNVNSAPSISTHPQSQTVSQGANVGFTVVATGTAPLSYQWRLNGTNLVGATSSAYNIASVTTNHAGAYSVIVSNSIGTATSSSAVLTVNASGTGGDARLASWLTAYASLYARIYQTDAAKLAGTTATTWSNGNQTQGSPTYRGIQEIFSSANWVYIRTTGLGSHIMGPWYQNAAHTATFVNMPLNQKVLYRFPRSPTVPGTKVNVGGEIGYMVDGVNLFDARDAVSYSNPGARDGDAPGTPGGLTGDGIWNRDAYVNEAITFDPAMAHQQNTGVYHYHASPIALRYLLNDHVDFNTTTKVYTNKTGTPGNHSPIIGWAKDGYPIYGPYGYSTALNASSGIRRMVSGFVPRNGQNGTVNLSITGRTTLPLWAQRVQNRTTLTSGQYGPAVSTTYPLGRYAEDNDYLGDLSKVQGVDFDLDEYNGRFCFTPEYPAGTYAYFSCIDATGAPAYPYNIGRQYYGNPTGGAVASISETVSTNFVGGPNRALELNTPTVDNSTRLVTLVWNSVEGGTYRVESSTNQSTWATQVNSLSSQGLTTQTNYTGLSGVGYARVSRTALATYDSANTIATSSQTDTESYTIDSLSITTHPQSQTVTAGNSVTFTVVASGAAPISYQWKFNGGDIPSANSSSYTIPSVAAGHAGTYSVVVSNSLASVTSSNATLTVNTPPAITTHPQTQTATAGSSVSFSVVATGTAPLTYQWRLNGSPISGATSSTYSIATVGFIHAGTYSVVVTNVAGSVTSSDATLSVNGPPTITTPPQSKSVTLGASVTFTVVAGGTAPLVFQWRFNGGNINGANGSSYTIPSVSTTDAGNYSVVVTNSLGSATSSDALLTVNTPPSITTPPQPLTVVQGSNATFTVTATGTAPLSYQWRFNGANINGATSSSFTRANASSSHAGDYSVVVTNIAGSVTSSAAALTVNVPPTINTHPVSKSVTQSSNVTFSVVATGTTPLGYQWRFNGTDIPSATGSSYSIASAATTDAGLYSVVVTNIAGSATSTNATLTVNIPPTITTPPQPLVVVQGSNATFAVTAAGTAPFSYQWRFNNSNIPGATNSSYTRLNANTNHAGNYSVVVTNVAGNIASSDAALTVNVPPAITTQPLSQTADPATSVNFSVVATGTAPLNYQWRFNGSPISGANSATYNQASVAAADAGFYSVLVSNVAGSITSSNALLVVNGDPSITSQPLGASVNEGAEVTFSVTAVGTPPLTYAWQRNGQPIPGAAGSTYSLQDVDAEDAASYTVIVTSGGGSVTSSPAVLSINIAPSIIGHPEPVTVNQGQAVGFGVLASGTGPLAYQWRFNNIEIPGATANTYFIEFANATNAGAYSVVVTNLAGVATSTNALLTVIVPPTINTDPQSQTIAMGATVTLSVAVSGTAPFAYQWRFNGANINNATDNTYSIVNATSDHVGAYSVLVTNSAGSDISASAIIAVNVPPAITLDPLTQSVLEGGIVTFGATASGTAPLHFQWRLNGENITGANSNTYSITNVTTAHAGSYSVVVTNIVGSDTSANAILTVNVPPFISTPPQAQSVVLNSNATFSATAGGTAPLSYQWLFNGSEVSGANSSTFSINGASSSHAGNYSVVVTNPYGSITSAQVALTVNVPPSIITQPQTQAVNQTSNVTFSVVAAGTAPLGYQWRFNGGNINGANASSYSINAANFSHAGTYSVVVTNLAGSITSSNATLSLNVAPAIITQPQSQPAGLGGSVTFSVTATGSPLNYQWRFNGGNIGGANASTYTIAAVNSGNSGTYSVVVSNPAGSVTSSNAVLTVSGDPTIVTHPASQTVGQGGSVTFSVVASGTAPILYQWQRNGAPINGVSGNTYTLNNVQAADAGTFMVIVVSPGGTAPSNPATLTVTVGPSITTQPQSQSVIAGSDAIFSVLATGSSLGYQWYFNSNPISGANSSSYTRPAAQAGDEGSYSVVVSNSGGSITSASAILNVLTDDDAVITSWLTEFSGQYARVYQSDAAKLAGTAVTTWSNGNQNQSLPAYCGVQEIWSSAAWVYIRTTGLGSHPMGPWYNNAGHTVTFPNLPLNQHALYRFPRSPIVPATKANAGGEVGYMVDGVNLFDSLDAISYANGSARDGDAPGTPNGVIGDGIWNRDAYVNEATTFDPAYAHQQNTGVYHYHASPMALRYTLDDHVDFNPTTKVYTPKSGTPTKHSPIIAWAKDGFPVYGPFGYSTATNPASGIRRMGSGYVLRNGQNGTVNLTSTGRTTLPLWAQRVQNRTTLSAGQYGPAVNASFPLGRYAEDNDYLGDLGFSLGVNFDLDQYNGRFCVTPEFPNGTYAYFSCVDASGAPAYPYNVGRQYYGSPSGGVVPTVNEPVSANFIGGANTELAAEPPSLNGNTLTITWTAAEGGTYSIQATSDVASGNWVTIATGVTPNRNTGSVTDTPNGPARFYRIIRTGVANYDQGGAP